MDSMITGRFLERTFIFIPAVKKMAREFQMLGYTDIVGFLESKKIYVIFVSLVSSVWYMASSSILLSPILSRMHTETVLIH